MEVVPINKKNHRSSGEKGSNREQIELLEPLIEVIPLHGGIDGFSRFIVYLHCVFAL